MTVSSPDSEIKTADEIRSLFVLDPDIAYLNHGGFGAVPNDILDERERWLRQIERNPTSAFQRELDDLLDKALTRLSHRLLTPKSTLAWMPNATFALNLVARSMMDNLHPGDEVLLTDVEYGAQYKLWKWVCEKTGATLKMADVYGHSYADRATQILDAVTPQTRVLLMSHITSATALLLPVQEVCRALTDRNVVTVVDGAHAPGHIELEPAAIGCDYYIGDLHKWQVAPLGSAFLCASRSQQKRLEPLVVGSAGADPELLLNKRTSRPGTFDPSAWLAVPKALEFHDRYLLPAVPAARALLHRAVDGLESLGFRPIWSKVEQESLLMAAVELPEGCDVEVFNHLLLDERVEAVWTTYHDKRFLRISVAWYTSDEEIQRLLECCERSRDICYG
jgi:isopenicillin-N epimerase